MSIKDHPMSRPRHTTPTTTTPRILHAQLPTGLQYDDGSNMKTPTRDTFAGISGQRPLPSPSSTSRKESTPRPATHLTRHDSCLSPNTSESSDVRMSEADEMDESDNESTASDATPSKKKKSQRFFCTEFPPCQLSFTRSEHLARHVRKHTGERPFQCHCLRRFSRLDNLRQHAQTVHLNEDIPGDSLAATSTRFQRKIITDRIRPPNTRPRAGSNQSTQRGHTRNWSGSSIGSVSDLASPDESRRRPPPLAMAGIPSPRGGLTINTYGGPITSPENYQSYFNEPRSGHSTPTSQLSAANSSPSIHSGVQSPVTMLSRGYSWSERQPDRRLSIPSSSRNPYAPGCPPGYSASGAQYLSQLPSSATSSNAPSAFGSPTSSVFSSDVRRDPDSGEVDRRRTWHPGTYGTQGIYGSRTPTSRLVNYHTPDGPYSAITAQPPSQAIRLPGIDSFDKPRPQVLGTPRRPSSPTGSDPYFRGSSRQSDASHSNRDSWGSISHGMNRLDVGQAQPPLLGRNEGPIRHQIIHAPPPPPAIMPQSKPSIHVPHKPAPAQITINPDHSNKRLSSGDAVTDRRKKRQAWYNGPIQGAPEPASNYSVVRTSPEGSSSSNEGVPSPSENYEPRYHPAVVHSGGFLESNAQGMVLDEVEKPTRNEMRTSYTVPQYPTLPHHLPVPRPGGGMDRLDALVAVATSETAARR